jgi:hypothetical protein
MMAPREQAVIARVGKYLGMESEIIIAAFQAIEGIMENGARDGARTRDLRRDRPDRILILQCSVTFSRPKNRPKTAESITHLADARAIPRGLIEAHLRPE